MKNTIKNMVERLETNIQLKEYYLKDDIQEIPKIIIELENEMIRLKELVSEYQFDDECAEIFFFKISKPQLLCKFLYLKKVYDIEMIKPNGHHSSIKNYYINELNQLEDYCNENINFYKYYRSRETYLDRELFIRKKQGLLIATDSLSFERDQKFSTNGDLMVARILANDLLSIYLNNKLTKLDCQIDQESSFDTSNNRDAWTDKKTDLVELIYAIHSEGSVNFGKIELKALGLLFAQMFNIDLRDLYHVFIEIRNRKIDRTIYLNRLIRALNKRMDEADAK